MKENNTRALIRDEMVEAGIVSEEGTLLTRIQDGREYLVMVSIVDITDWNEDSGE